ncbi:MAG: TPR end-of-group domain-containing protein, partial [Pseudomonadota bacterium]
MKNPLALFIALFIGTHLFAQTTPSEMMEDFVANKADGFNTAYDQRDLNTFNSLLSEYLTNYENLSGEEKGPYTYILNNIYYNLTCIYALSNDKKMAIMTLSKAIDAGYNDYRHVQSDTDLDSIRNEKEFLELNRKLKATGDYLDILK